jgi:cell division protein FtsW
MLLMFGVSGAVAILLLLEPNMSITICVLMVAVIMIFIGGAKVKHLIALGVPLMGAGVALILAEPYRVRRLFAFVDPWASSLDEGYQLIQSYYALGSGGLFGVGLGNSRQKYLFLPFAESDFILSVIGEEIGLVGILLIVAIFLFIVVRGFIIAQRAKDRFSCYVASGISSVIAVQTALNIAVVCGAVPPTGLPLPFISAGGSSLVAYLVAVGILMNISRQTKVSTLDWMNNIGCDYEKRDS